MPGFRVTCPQCNKSLVLKDRSLLGRKGKCPKCGHRFVLTASEKPERKLVEPLPRGVAGESVPDDLPVVPTVVAASDQPADVPKIELKLTDEDQAPYRHSARRSKGRGRTRIVIGLVLTLCGLGGAAAYLMTGVNEHPRQQVVSKPHAPPAPVQAATVPSLPDSQETTTDNDPIELLMVPSGARLIVNLRPAELWSDDARLAELRACLTEDVVSSITDFLRNVTHRDPQQIEEVLLAWILGARGTEPQLAAVVHLAHEERLSDLINEFGSEPLDEFAQPKIYLHEQQAVLIRDCRTLAFAPRELADDLSDWVDVPNHNTSDGILALLQQTDRNRLLTVICEPADVSRHVEMLFPQTVHDIARATTSWFAELVETMAWSVETGTEFRSEIILRGPSTQSASTLEELVTSRMQALPSQLTDAVRRMHPTRSGVRKLIGRFPAMLEVYRQATQSSLDLRVVRLVTALPPKAGPNLALTSVLTWAESTRLPLSAGSSAPDSTAVSESLTIAQRLQLPVDAEFNRTPLQEAIDYIAGEINVSIVIDGDALKDAGYTKNMPQTFTLGTVTAQQALREIVEQYQEDGKQMVLVIDEEVGRAILKTKKFADAAGETPFDLIAE